MRKSSLKFILVLALLFFALVAIQLWQRGILLKDRLDGDFRKASRMVFAGLRGRQSDFWAGRKRDAKATARLFTRLLLLEPNASTPALIPVESFRYRFGDGEETLGIITPGVVEMPVQAKAIAASFPQVRSRLSALAPEFITTIFISKDNWLASYPARKAMELPDDLILVRELLYIECTPAKNPGKEVRFIPPRFDQALGRWIVGVGMPVYIEGGFQGMVGLEMPIEPLLEALADYGRPLGKLDDLTRPLGGPVSGSPGPNLFVMDGSFRPLLHRDLASRLKAKDAVSGATPDFLPFISAEGDIEAIKTIKTMGTFPAERMIGLPRGRQLMLTSLDPSTGWHYVFTLGDSEILAQTRRGEWTLFLLNSLALLLGLFLLFLFLRSTVIAPLSRISGDVRLWRQPAGATARSPKGTAAIGRPQRAPFIAELGRLSAGMQQLLAELQQQTDEASEAREYLEKLMQTSQSMVITTDRKLHPTFINDFGLKKLQIEKDAVLALRPGDFFERKFIREAAGELKKSGQIINLETTLTLRSGEKVDVSLSLSRIRNARLGQGDDDGPPGQYSGYLVVITDISKRKKAEIDLKNQILFSRQIFQSIPEMILIVDRRLRVTFINKRARDLIQAGGAAVIGQNLNAILSKSALESGFDELVRGVLEGGSSIHRINTLSPFMEKESYVDLIVEPLKSGNVTIGGIIMLRDISEWRSLTAQLRSLQGFMQKLINASPYAVISINEHGLIATWNSAAEKILGVPFAGAFGQNLFALLPLFNKYKDAINEVMILKKTIYLNDEQVYIGEEDFKVANLTLYPVTAEPIGVVIHIEDVSALKQLESSLIHAQKMESLGLLTSHIIHDFNNLLSGIMGYASLLEKKIADNPKVQKYISTIITSSERASELINQLLNFSRKKMAEKEIISLNDLIKESLDFLAMNLKPINLDIQLHESQILLQADKTKISQIIINLIINARDALENIARPIIRLRTDLVEISNESNLLDGKYARIEISDNGSGISRENQKRIFEPFFTTKGKGRGTGLGLAIVREIIQDYNGRIDLASEPGHGSAFTILLPVFAEALIQPVILEEKASAALLKGLVLLIDDEEVVRDIGCDMLKSLGLNCLTAANGTEGIEIFKKNAADIILVILDIEMPGISGEKVFQILRELRPEVKILIASGYGREYLETEIFKSKIGSYMPKPFKIEQLSYQVNKILGNRDV